MAYIPRVIEPYLIELSGRFPCIGLTGPRQSGKSTLLRHCFPNHPYVTFDDPEEEFAFRDDPRGFLARFPSSVILDEVQRLPDLFRYIKMAVDAQPDRMGQFFLTGSNQFSLMHGAAESLAGRIGLLSLLPLELSEIPERIRPESLWAGSYPRLVLSDYQGAREWYSSYLGTYLEKDIRRVHDIGKLADFQVLVRLLAARTGQELNTASLAREIGVSAKTIDAWVSVLEAGYIVFKLPPFHSNIGKRLIKRPKVYFWDTGLVSSLVGIRNQETWEEGPLKGALFENHVISEVLKQTRHRGLDRELSFYRDNAGKEIDLILLDRSQRALTLCEIKAGQTPKVEWLANLQSLSPLLETALGVPATLQVIYRGEAKRSWPRAGISYVNVLEPL